MRDFPILYTYDYMYIYSPPYKFIRMRGCGSVCECVFPLHYPIHTHIYYDRCSELESFLHSFEFDSSEATETYGHCCGYGNGNGGDDDGDDDDNTNTTVSFPYVSNAFSSSLVTTSLHTFYGTVTGRAHIHAFRCMYYTIQCRVFLTLVFGLCNCAAL